ncbi:hypothetical protein HYW75_05295 [Candidatus Pacearchaeota archaeon]|nr:hypothetical protein [Candidatus Pacearchaeota archaeon]
MSWTDKKAVETIKQLRDSFKVNTFVETGTFKGINARLHAKNFTEVITCELIKDYFLIAQEKLRSFINVKIVNISSPEFLKQFTEEYKNSGRNDMIIFYLDAHFYDPNIPKEKRFVVLDELRALKDFKNGIIIIHDFDNGLGHITYDGQPLDISLVKNDLMQVNSEFNLYTNELATCEIWNEKTILDSGMIIDFETLDNIRYANSTPRLTYRGILYAIPSELGKEFNLKRIWN